MTSAARALDKEVLTYLEARGVAPDLLTQVRTGLRNGADSDPGVEAAAVKALECKLARAWRYAEEGVMEVAISRLSGDTDYFEVFQWTSVRDLKDMIEAKMQIPAVEQVLLKGGQELKSDKESLATYRVTVVAATLQVLQVEARATPEKEGNLEIHLTHADGIPEGSMVSIRAGDSRRLAPLRFDEPFRFSGTRESANPFKIDIFSQLGRSRLVLRATEPHYVARIQKEDGGVATLEFEARDNSDRERRHKKTDISKAQSGSVRARAQRTVLASRYMDEHGLHQYMQGLIQSLITERPENPYQYMIDQLQAAILTRPTSVLSAESTSAPSRQPSRQPSLLLTAEKATQVPEEPGDADRQSHASSPVALPVASSPVPAPTAPPEAAHELEHEAVTALTAPPEAVPELEENVVTALTAPPEAAPVLEQDVVTAPGGTETATLLPPIAEPPGSNQCSDQKADQGQYVKCLDGGGNSNDPGFK